MTRCKRGDALKIFRKMLASATSNVCLIWPYKKAGAGYGQVWVNDHYVYVHHLAWQMVWGPIPHGKHVLHHCDTPPCFNPLCLFLGDELANKADQKAKGRTLIGETNPVSKLTENDVKKMRSLYQKGVVGFGMIALGKRFGVSHTTARKAIKGSTWKHV